MRIETLPGILIVHNANRVTMSYECRWPRRRSRVEAGEFPFMYNRQLPTFLPNCKCNKERRLTNTRKIVR